MPSISFEAKLYQPDADKQFGEWTLITLPSEASSKLPSRGMTLVEGTLNGVRLRVVLQPNGQGSHWFRVDQALLKAAGVNVGDTVALAITPTKAWPEPELSTEVKKALAADPEAHARWVDITPMARWDWINWMGSVKLPKTLQERPDKLCSMLKAGKRRPCCFNRSILMTPSSAELL